MGVLTLIPVLTLDTSVAVPLMVQTHGAHSDVFRWWAHRKVALNGHVVAATYSGLTRLPGGLRLAPADAARLLLTRFDPPLVLASETALRLPKVLSKLEVAWCRV